MKTQDNLFDQILNLTNSNVELYNHWESQIAAHLAKDWGIDI